MDSNTELKRIKWRCQHRGIREMDLVFARFLEQHYPRLDADQRQQFEALIDVPDLDIMNWILQRENPPARFQIFIEQMRGGVQPQQDIPSPHHG